MIFDAARTIRYHFGPDLTRSMNTHWPLCEPAPAPDSPPSQAPATPLHTDMSGAQPGRFACNRREPFQRRIAATGLVSLIADSLLDGQCPSRQQPPASRRSPTAFFEVPASGRPAFRVAGSAAAAVAVWHWPSRRKPRAPFPSAPDPRSSTDAARLRRV